MNWRHGRPLVTIVGMLCALVLHTRTVEAQSASPRRTLLDQYCVTRHNQRTLTADLALDTVDVDDGTVAPLGSIFWMHAPKTGSSFKE